MIFNQHLAYLCVLYAKLTLHQVKVSQFTLVLYSPPVQSLGKGRSFVLIAVIRKMPWRENVRVELKWFNSSFSFFLLYLCRTCNYLSESYVNVPSDIRLISRSLEIMEIWS